MDCDVGCANAESANSNDDDTADSEAIFILDDERDVVVGQPLRLPLRQAMLLPYKLSFRAMSRNLVSKKFEKNTLLFGADATPRIVAIELGEAGTVKVYCREEDGS